MDTLVKSDIFFFITAIAVVVVTLLLVPVIYYVIKILRNIRSISETAKKEAENLSQDINDLRNNVREEGANIKHAASFFGKIIKRYNK